MSKWTPEQQQAINASDVSIIVSAAAGSGKTSVLVEHIIKVISDVDENGNIKVPANQMVIVTFTKDAAAEMKHRLSKRLSEKIAEDPYNDALSEQHSLLQFAKISTIHSFCIDMIRDNVNETNVSPGFRIMEENEENIVIESCIADIIEESYKNYPDDIELLYKYFCESNDKKIEEIIFDVYKFMCSIPFSDEWLENVCNKFESTEFSESLLDEYISLTGEKMKDVLSDVSMAHAILKSNSDGSDKAEKAVDAMSEEYMNIANIVESFKSDCKSLKSLKYKTITTKNIFDEDVEEQIKKIRNDYKKDLKGIFEGTGELISHFDEDVKSHYEICRIIQKFILNVKEKVNEVKAEKNAISFSDAESMALELLVDKDENGNIKKSQIAFDLSQFYKIIMVDEFQDTNDNQNLIFRLLSDTGNYKADRNGKNLFFVGDVKQSIYGFRLANPEIFTETIDKSVEYSENVTENAFIRLNKNFRSSKEVIDFVNAVFRSIMNRNTAQTDYNDNEELVQGANFADTEKSTEVCIIDADSDEDSAKLNAEWIAKRIHEMLDDGEVSDKNGEDVRPCKNSDFCILLRDNKNSGKYADALRKYGIPSYLEETDGYTEAREVSLVLDIMKVIDNPLLDIPLTAIMLSPIFSMTPDDVAEIRLKDRKRNIYNALYETIQSIKNKENPQTDELILMQKAEKVYNTINELRIYSATDTLEQFVRRIYDYTDVISIMQIYDDHEKKVANLRILIDYAKNYQSGSNSGLSGFLRFIEKSSERSGRSFRYGSTASGSENVVSIKTMHKSKGLEFPFVFIAGTEKKFNTKEFTHSSVMKDKEYGLGFVLNNPELLYRYHTIPFELIKLKKQKQQLSEEMRLLYVALTRAKDKLFIPVVTDRKSFESMKFKVMNGLNDSIIMSAKSMQDWILMSLLSMNCAEDYDSIFDYYSKEILTESPEMKVSFYQLSEEKEIEETEKTVETAPVNYSEAEKLIKSFEFFENGYDFSFSKLPSILSVSEVSKTNEFISRTPKFMKDKKKLTGAEAGTALHTFMQYADFSKIKNSPEKELENCVSRGLVSPNQSEVIKLDKVNKFTSSELFNRVINSDKFIRERKFRISFKEIDTGGIVPLEYQGQDIFLQGSADIIFHESDGAVIVDYKTDYVKSEEELIEKYETQLLLYKKAIEKVDDIKIKECIIYSFYLDKSIILK